MRGDLLTIARRIGHDLGASLAGVTITGHVLKEMVDENDATASRFIQLFFKATDEMAKLIEQVGCVAKASVQTLPKTSVVMADVVGGVLEELAAAQLIKQAVVTQPKAWPEIPGVTAWLKIIWWNLLKNALERGGESARIEISWQAEAGGHRFRVSDNGLRIGEKDQDGLFHDFQNLHAAENGSGLSLSVVKRLVELQGGQCGCESPQESGAAFFFTLPTDKTFAGK